MDYIKLKTFDLKRLLLFAVIFATAFWSFWLYSSEDVWMFFCCLLSYGVQVICIPFVLVDVLGNKQVKVTADNIASYAQKEVYYKILFVILSVITLLLDTFPYVAMSGVGNIPEYEGGLFVTILTMGIWAMWLYGIAGACRKNLKKEYDNCIASAEKARMRSEQRRLEKERIEAEFNALWQELSNKYGVCTIDVCIGANKNEIKQHIYVFEDSATIVLNGEEIAFNNILGFTLQDDSKTIMTKDMASYTSTTKTSTGSMIGRAVVGGMLTGGLGAVAGAATAKKETITTPNQEQSITTTSIKHNYICYVNVNDLANPIREIYLGEDSKNAQTIANLLNVIIERNR